MKKAGGNKRKKTTKWYIAFREFGKIKTEEFETHEAMLAYSKLLQYAKIEIIHVWAEAK